MTKTILKEGKCIFIYANITIHSIANCNQYRGLSFLIVYVSSFFKRNKIDLKTEFMKR